MEHSLDRTGRDLDRAATLGDKLAKAQASLAKWTRLAADPNLSPRTVALARQRMQSAQATARRRRKALDFVASVSDPLAHATAQVQPSLLQSPAGSAPPSTPSAASPGNSSSPAPSAPRRQASSSGAEIWRAVFLGQAMVAPSMAKEAISRKAADPTTPRDERSTLDLIEGASAAGRHAHLVAHAAVGAVGLAGSVWVALPPDAAHMLLIRELAEAGMGWFEPEECEWQVNPSNMGVKGHVGVVEVQALACETFMCKLREAGYMPMLGWRRWAVK